MSRVARIAAFAVVRSRPSASNSLCSLGRSSTSLDDWFAADINQKRAAIDKLASCTTGILMGRVARIAALAVEGSRRSASRSLRRLSSRSSGHVIDRLAISADEDIASIDLTASLTTRIFMGGAT